MALLAQEQSWCGQRQGGVFADSVKIADTGYSDKPSRLHVVDRPFQVSAQARLAQVSIIDLSRAEAQAMLSAGDRLATADPVLLVRGGSIPGTNLGGYYAVHYSRSGEQLFIESGAIAPRAAVEGNIALMIELADPVTYVSISCSADE